MVWMGETMVRLCMQMEPEVCGNELYRLII